MTLSRNCILLYVLRQSGVRGHMTEGKVELHECEGSGCGLNISPGKD
jgi:hypothetical protein